MKKLNLLAFALLLLATSCSTYQVSMLNSPDLKKDERTGTFTMENDSVRVVYSFSGLNSPIGINIYNKTSTPLYVDWQRSALIIGDNVISYASNQVNINGSVSSTTWNSRSSLNFSSGSLNATASLPKEVTFLPPHTRINASPVETAHWVVPVVPDNEMRAEKAPYYGSAEASVKVKVADFTAENSPVKMRSYLTLYAVDGNTPKPMVYQNEFFIAKLIRTKVDPDFLINTNGPRADYILTSQKQPYTIAPAVTPPQPAQQ